MIIPTLFIEVISDKDKVKHRERYINLKDPHGYKKKSDVESK